MDKKEFYSFVAEETRGIYDLLCNTVTPMQPYGDDRDQLVAAMKYSIGGKMLRPFFLLKLNKLVGNESKLQTAIVLAAALELIHSFSLVHDDLPAMDNDDYRRGKLSCHKKFGEGAAILTGNALMSCAFELLIDQGKDLMHSEVLVEVMRIFCKSIGIEGLIGGQMKDISRPDSCPEDSIDELLIALKTGSLFRVAAEAVGVIHDCNKEQIETLVALGNQYGLLFQLQDDIMDRDCIPESISTIMRDRCCKVKEIAKDLLIKVNNWNKYTTENHNEAMSNLLTFLDIISSD